MNDAAAALTAAYLERRQELIRFFAARLRSAGAAEDLVQDIYLRIQSVPPDARIRDPASYLYRLGSNLMLDRLRGERRSATRDQQWRDVQFAKLGDEDLANEPQADDAVAARQMLREVVAVLEGLTPQTRRVFRMHKFDGLSHAEVAAALGISRSAVEKHCMAALKRLTEKLR
jgi:RNA polymerase sigma factor (sigma-70 family)